MNLLKNAVLILSLTLLGTHAKAQVIGYLEGEHPVITVNQSTLIANYSENLENASGIKGNFTRAMVLKGEDGYVLVFSGPEYVSKLAVKTNQQTRSGQYQLNVMGKTSCTTTDCATETNGCAPKLLGGCNPCNNGGKCSRTTSTYSLLGNIAVQ